MLGAPGAGKGTQAKLLSAATGVPHVSTGDIFRKNIAGRTELGRKAKEYTDAGLLVPDEVTNGIVRDRILEDDCKKGFILDGYPRTIAQAQYLDNLAKSFEFSLTAVINVHVPDEAIVERMAGRRACAKCGRIYHVASNPPKDSGKCDACGGDLRQRVDDAAETVLKRLELYHAETAPLIDYYTEQGRLATVDGTKPIDDIQAEIRRILGIAG
jgi:adenylate kinase